MNTYQISLTFADGSVHGTTVQSFTPILAIGIARERLTELPGEIVGISCQKIS
jgi:hypothetical protein